MHQLRITNEEVLTRANEKKQPFSQNIHAGTRQGFGHTMRREGLPSCISWNNAMKLKLWTTEGKIDKQLELFYGHNIYKPPATFERLQRTQNHDHQRPQAWHLESLGFRL